MEKTTRRLPIVERDEWLLPAEQELNNRHERYMDKMNAIVQAAGSLVDYANGYRYFGWQRDETLDGWWLREWRFQQLAADRNPHAARPPRRMERLLPHGDVP